MKIKQLEINNYQIHKKSILNFDPGVNIISGNSRNGKSSIFRAIKWNFQNKPSGDSFIPNDNPKALTSVTTTLDDFSIVHDRSSKVHEYKLIKEGDEKLFKKFGQSVPDDITELLDVAEHNIQSQHTPYFLLQDSGSDIAEKLNKIAGLEDIDNALDSINTYVRKVQTETKLSEKQIDGYQTRIDELQFVDNAEIFINTIDKSTNEVSVAETRIKGLEFLINEIQSLEIKIIEYDKKIQHKQTAELLHKNIDRYANSMLKYTNIEKNITDIVNMNKQYSEFDKKTVHKDTVSVTMRRLASLKETQDKMDKLVSSISGYSKLSEMIEELDDWLSCKKYNTKVIDLIDMFNLKVIKTKEIGKLTDGLDRSTKELFTIATKVSDAIGKKKDYLKGLGICPLCGRG